MRDGKRAKRAAVKRIFQRKDASFRCSTAGRGLSVSVGARELQRAVNRFGAAIAKEHAVEAGPFGEFARERSLIRILEEIRNMDGAAGLAANHAHQARMGVAERIDGDASKEIQILAPSRIVKPAAAAMREHH